MFLYSFTKTVEKLYEHNCFYIKSQKLEKGTKNFHIQY